MYAICTQYVFEAGNHFVYTTTKRNKDGLFKSRTAYKKHLEKTLEEAQCCKAPCLKVIVYGAKDREVIYCAQFEPQEK